MATQIETPRPELTYQIAALLRGLRWRIRAYVWVEGLLIAAAWLALTWWVFLALDYLPVVVGASEMPWPVRAVMLLIIGAGLLVILYRWVLKRAFRPLGDRSMAVLLERRFLTFRDSLLTTVELTHRPEHAREFNRGMLAHTYDNAVATTPDVRLSRVFNLYPLAVSGLIAFALIVPMGLFFAANSDAAMLWSRRLFLLSDDPWPRFHEIEVADVVVVTNRGDTGETVTQVLPFGEDKTVKVAKGANVRLRVRAYDTKRLPQWCRVLYSTDDGDFGAVTMERHARLRREPGSKARFQEHTFEDQPLRNVLSTVRFDVLGVDHRVSGYAIEVVESPVVIGTYLDVVYPDYMVDERIGLNLPRTVRLTPGTDLPRGAEVTVRCRTNKELKGVLLVHTASREEIPVRLRRQVTIDDPQGKNVQVSLIVPATSAVDERTGRIVPLAIERPVQIFDSQGERIGAAVAGKQVYTVVGGRRRPVIEKDGLDVLVKVPGRDEKLPAKLLNETAFQPGFEFDISPLAENLEAEASLHDVDDVVAGDLHRITVRAVEDMPPQAELRLVGIGDEVTPEVLIPLSGTITDDHGLARAWFEIQPGQASPLEMELPVTPAGDVKTSVDFRELGRRSLGKVELKPGDLLVIDILAADKHDLEGGPHVVHRNHHELGVVTRDKLIRNLEKKEAEQRERLELIIGNVEMMRDTLLRIKSDANFAEGGLDPADVEESDEDPARRIAALRAARVAEAAGGSSKESQELLGVAESFDYIRLELQNNRIDDKEREQRLEKEIAAPLRTIANRQFAELDLRLERLKETLGKGEPVLQVAVDQAIEQVDVVLLEMNAVLDKLLKIETFSELLDIVRELIEDEEEVIDGTKEARKEQLLKDLSN